MGLVFNSSPERGLILEMRGFVDASYADNYCGFGQGHMEPDPVPVPVRTKSPEDPTQMQRKRTGPKST